MHVHFLDPYHPGRSPIHTLDARVKFVLALAIILTTALTPTGAWPAYIFLFSLALAAEVLTELGVSFYLKRAVLALPFVLAALPLVFTLQSAVLVSISLGSWQVPLYQAGVERFLSIALKSWISVQVAILLATTTQFPELQLAMRAVRLPRLLVSIFGLMWRYMFVMADEALRLLRARAARSGEADRSGLRSGGSLAWRAGVAGGMAGSLFIRAIERSDRIYMAMLARGYNGEVRSAPLPRLKRGDGLVLAAGLALLAFLLMISLLFWG